MNEPKWTPEEEDLLHRADLITEIYRRRDADRPQEESEKKLLRFLQSPGGTAIITILLGSLLAPLVITHIQVRNARDDQALDEYRQYLKLQQESVKETYALVGRITYGSQDLITLTRPTFDLQRAPENERSEFAKQQREMLKNYNDSIHEWRVKENIQGVLISYYFYGHSEVSESWRSVRSAVNDFTKCAQRVRQMFMNKQPLTTEREDCEKKKDVINASLENLSLSISTARRFTWQQLDIPALNVSEPAKSPSQRPTP
jgi:hypothetical protein